MNVGIIVPYLCILLQPAIGSATFNVTVQEISSAVTSLKVTALRGNIQIDGTFYDANVTWFDAVQRCAVSGYDRLEASESQWQRWDSIVHRLRDNNFRFPVNIWLGVFRLYPYSSTWYHGTDTCKEYKGTTHDSDNTTWQCLSAYFSNLTTRPVMKARHCLDEYPFICSTKISTAKAILYAGFKMEALPGNAFSTSKFANSTHGCQQTCRTRLGCIAFEYNNDTRSCKAISADDYYGYFTYTLVRSENTSHVLNHGCNFTLSSKPVYSTLPTSQNTLNICNLTFIPERFCAYPNNDKANQSDECTNCESTNHTADGTIYAEISKRSTSRFKRGHTSSKDDRTGSKVSGGIAIVIIVVPFCLSCFIDVTNILTRCRKRKKSKCVVAERAGDTKTDLPELVTSEGPDRDNMTMTMTTFD